MKQALEGYLNTYNPERPHQGRGMNGRTSYKAFTEGVPGNSKKEDKKPKAKAALS